MKPIIFFSHSSRDRDAILPIRDRLLNGTGNAIKVFMSSDGASIPFGKNWLKEIEDALTECRLMFVWMTPASIPNNWIPFESGFAYSKGIRVVPIGFQSVRLEDLPAPINMLQGFNVTSSASLNNIIAIINDEFSLTFPELFDDVFYQQQVEDLTSEDSPEALDFVRVVECEMWPRITVDDNTTAILHEDWFERLKGILVEQDLSFTESRGVLFGTGFRVTTKTDSDKSKRPVISIDPLALNSTRQAWATASAQLYDSGITYTVFKLQMVAGIELPQDESLIGARLLRSEVSFDTHVPHVLYRYRNVDFRINIYRGPRKTTSELVLLVPKENKEPIPMLSLLRLLAERRVLTTS
jgi:hypothetical protein